jgi:hypothetical protein
LFDEAFVLNSTMKRIFYLLSFILAFAILLFANKVSGIVVDKADQPVPFANIAFKDSNEGAVANEDGRFILNQLKHTAL